MKKFVTKLKGIGLLELMLSLAIIAILLVMATRYYGATTKSQRVDDTIQLIGELETAVNTAVTNDGTTYDKITIPELVSNGYLAKGRTTGATGSEVLKNPWPGKITFTGAATTGITVTFDNVPKQQCTDLSKKFFGDSAPSGTCGTEESTSFVYVIK